MTFQAMAEAMTPDKNSSDVANRNAVILKIAKVCKQQGSYHISAKKFAEAGERTKAMKVLIKTRDTGKIIKFASETLRDSNHVKLLALPEQS